MSRFLIVVPPVVERVRPAAAIGRELEARGHEVAWVAYRHVLDGIVPAGATIMPVTDPGDDVTKAPRLRPVGGVRNPGELILQWNDFLVPLARVMLPAVHAAVDSFGPEVVVADQHALAGAAVAHLRRLPWVTVVPTSAGLVDPSWDRPEIKRHIRQERRRFFREIGFDEATAARTDPQTSRQLVIVFSTQALTGPLEVRASRHLFVGPCLATPPDDAGLHSHPFDGGRPLVVVSLEADRWQHRVRLYRAAAAALSSLPVRAAILGPPEVAELVADPSAGVRVLSEASLPALAQRATAVVCDGGHRTVSQALAGGVPLVVVPVTGDQPIVADQVVRAGAGVRVSARWVDDARLRMAVERILTDTRIRHGAEQVQDSFAAARGAVAAVPRLEAVVDGPPTRRQTTAGSRERKRPQLRERIVDEATTLIFKQGMAATTVDQIAARVHISQTTFFNCFPNKTALVESLFARLVDRWYGAVGDAHPADVPVAHKVRTLFQVTADLTPDQHRLVRDLILDATRFRGEVPGGLMRMVAYCRDELAAGQARGEVRDDHDAATLAACILGLYTSVRLLCIDDPRYPIAERLHAAGHMAVELLRPPALA